jgi:hypothetical protein
MKGKGREAARNVLTHSTRISPANKPHPITFLSASHPRLPLVRGLPRQHPSNPLHSSITNSNLIPNPNPVLIIHRRPQKLSDQSLQTTMASHSLSFRSLFLLLLLAIQTASSRALLSSPDLNPPYPKAISVSNSINQPKKKKNLFLFFF